MNKDQKPNFRDMFSQSERDKFLEKILEDFMEHIFKPKSEQVQELTKVVMDILKDDIKNLKPDAAYEVDGEKNRMEHQREMFKAETERAEVVFKMRQGLMIDPMRKLEYLDQYYRNALEGNIDKLRGPVARFFNYRSKLVTLMADNLTQNAVEKRRQDLENEEAKHTNFVLGQSLPQLAGNTTATMLEAGEPKKEEENSFEGFLGKLVIKALKDETKK